MRKPRKDLGQNFLRNEESIERLVTTSEPKVSDIYLEIGPGKGAVTKRLVKRAKKIIAVELDNNLFEKLRTSFKEFKNIDFVKRDILCYIEAYCHATNRSTDFNKVIGSIPYQITSPLLHQLANLATKIDSVTLLIQKEVAEKITAKPPNASYLSNFVQTFFSVEYVNTIPKENFYPTPKVDGAILKLEPIVQPEGSERKMPTVEPKKWSAFLHQGFKHPRKMLKRSFDERILTEACINPLTRPQELDFKSWMKLYHLLEQSS